MTFEEWYKNAPLVKNAKDAFRACWEAGFQSGQNHQRELERLSKYDDSIFAMRNKSDW